MRLQFRIFYNHEITVAQNLVRISCCLLDDICKTIFIILPLQAYACLMAHHMVMT